MAKTTFIDRDPEDDWAEVELYRWQYGTLPQNDSSRKLDVSKALAAMANAFEEGYKSKDASKFPAPFNIQAVLNYCSRKMKDKNELLACSQRS